MTDAEEATWTGTFTLAGHSRLKRGARVLVADIHHLPTWVEVTDFDPDTRMVSYRIMSNDELAAWPDSVREDWNSREV